MALLADRAMNHLVSGRSPRRMGTTHPDIVPCRPFPPADGYIVLAESVMELPE